MNVFSVTDAVVTVGKTGSIGKSSSELQKLNVSCVFVPPAHLNVTQYNTLCGSSHICHAALYNASNSQSSIQQPKTPWPVSRNKSLTNLRPSNKYTCSKQFSVCCALCSVTHDLTCVLPILEALQLPISCVQIFVVVNKDRPT